MTVNEAAWRLVVGAVIVDPSDRVFLHRRSDERTLSPGAWDIPGGHVMPGEAVYTALGREVWEETGWRVKAIVAELGDIIWTGSDGITRREADFLIDVEGDLTQPRLEWPKHVEWRWVTAEDVRRLLPGQTSEERLVREIVLRGRVAHEQVARRDSDG